MISRTGRLVGGASRVVTTADSGWPEDTSLTSALSGSVIVPPEAIGAMMHLHVDIAGSGSTAACRAHLFGWRNDTRVGFHLHSTKGQIGRWYFLGSLNGQEDIDSTACGGFIDSDNRMSYAESTLHTAPYTRLVLMFTNFTAISSVSGTILFEV